MFEGVEIGAVRAGRKGRGGARSVAGMLGKRGKGKGKGKLRPGGKGKPNQFQGYTFRRTLRGEKQ